MDVGKHPAGGCSSAVYLMRNAIETQRFAFDEQKRENLLRSLKIEGKFVVGNVARFSYQKIMNC